jgi:hypothetical protein
VIIGMLQGYPGARSKAAKAGAHGLTGPERAVLLVVVQWRDGLGKPTIKAVGRATGRADRTVRRIVRRLAESHMLVNLDGGLRGVALAINPVPQEWNLSGLKALRGAYSAGVDRGFRGDD